MDKIDTREIEEFKKQAKMAGVFCRFMVADGYLVKARIGRDWFVWEDVMDMGFDWWISRALRKGDQKGYLHHDWIAPDEREEMEKVPVGGWLRKKRVLFQKVSEDYLRRRYRVKGTREKTVFWIEKMSDEKQWIKMSEYGTFGKVEDAFDYIERIK